MHAKVTAAEEALENVHIPESVTFIAADAFTCSGGITVVCETEVLKNFPIGFVFDDCIAIFPDREYNCSNQNRR